MRSLLKKDFLILATTLVLSFGYSFCGIISIAGEINKNAWISAENVPLRKEPEFITDWLCLLNYGQQIKIIEEKNDWVKVQLIDAPYWEYDGTQWLQKRGNDCINQYGWLNKSLLLNTKPGKPKREKILFKAFSPAFNNKN
ncbi:SH3 domain-containing protein [Desulforegula conservatrix]|uniref:hypothetical protein n=1 Tax=Desulforegula conservatrix TaxID=153026 RepID=UPI0004899538|nr:hypothetical protein [Desulforegula conservatrix]